MMEAKESYVALGSFDGIHEGHMTLIKKVVQLAKENNCKSVVYTFKNHPREVINKNNKIRLLMDNEYKLEILKECNVDYVCFQEFNKTFMKESPEDFIKSIKEKFKAKGIVVGFNYRFGYKNLGDVNLLKDLSKKYNYELYIMPKCIYKDKTISSTEIRNKLLEGNVEEANEMLGKPYMLSGKVVGGRKIGRTIGFPTANLNYNKKMILPKVGVYFTNVCVNNKIYKAITNIGDNPTVDGKDITVESFLLDFDKDIYNIDIKVYFIKRIRSMQKFNSLEELKNQLQKDKNYAKEEKMYI